MKNKISAIVLAIAALPLTAGAQLVEVESIAKVPLADGLGVEIATIAPDASYAVAGAAKGLVKISLADGTAVKIDDMSSPYGVYADGNRVVYRKSHIGDDLLTRRSLEAYDVATGAVSTLVAPCRDLTSDAATAVKPFAASIDHGHLVVTNNGQRTVIDPQGRGSYLWPSVSPDGQRVVYYLCGRGAYACNLDGTNAVELGQLRAPKWLDNDRVVAMNDFANITGTKVTSSAIIVADLAGNRQTLTDSSLLAMYPSPSADGSKIAFTVPTGDLYVITLKPANK